MHIRNIFNELNSTSIGKYSIVFEIPLLNKAVLYHALLLDFTANNYKLTAQILKQLNSVFNKVNLTFGIPMQFIV